MRILWYIELRECVLECSAEDSLVVYKQAYSAR
jgi:hypothetical protein